MSEGWRGEAGEDAEKLHDEMAEELDPETRRETFEREMAEEDREDEAGGVGDEPERGSED
jgi:hypothetical protein